MAGIPPAAAWEVLTDTRRWPEWGPSISEVELASGASPFISAGSAGRVRTAVGVWLPFQITEFEDGRRWAWSVAGVPATTHDVEAVGSDGCAVSFLVPALAAPYLGVCAIALRRIEAMLRRAEHG